MRDRRHRFLPLSGFASILLIILLATGLASSQKSSTSPGDVVLVGAKVYSSPTADPIDDAVILIRDGKIATIGKRGQVDIPKSVQIIDCSGKVITAGFWNSHVHFTEDAWADAATAPVPKLEAHMQEMLTHWGFTTVWDIGSFPQNTLALRKRIEAGEVAGPKIYTTAGAIYPENGIPVYIPPAIASQIKPFEAATPADASRLAKQSLAMGGDGIKLFTGAIMGHGKVTPMPTDIVRAAVDVAHAQGKPVFAHPSNHVGTDNALAGGVDILAHTIPEESGWTAEELRRMKAQHTALTPTLTLWEVELEKEHASAEDERQFVQSGVDELKAFFDQGGTVLFGTDVGYTQHYDTTEEYVQMARSGMTWRDILASLTTNPATFFKAGHAGEVAEGVKADLVVLRADPAKDVRNFAKVDYTIRSGKVIYRK
jgi:imidazolonepropionase-like amidohydrolase